MMNASSPHLPTPTRRQTSPAQWVKQLAPPQTLIHIGAGTGQGDMHQWHTWPIAQALIIDADPTRLEWAERLAASQPRWQVVSAIVAELPGSVTYHQASNPDEDGLIPAQCLSTLWPNLRATGQTQCPAQDLDQLLAQPDAPTLQQGNAWLLVDCLPALSILKGAVSTVAQCSVIWVRAMLQPIDGITPDAALTDIAHFLQARGFKCLSVTESHQPALGHALFVRDWQTAWQQQNGILNQQSRLTAECLATVAELQTKNDHLAQNNQNLIAGCAELTVARDQFTLQRDVETELKIKALAQRDAEAQATLAAIAQRDAIATERNQIAAVRDAQAKLAAERQSALTALQSQYDQLAQEQATLIAASAELTVARDQLALQHDAEANAKTEALAQRDAEATAKSAAIAQRDALAAERNQLAAARDEQAKLATERQAALTALEAQHDQLAQEKAKLIAASAELTGARDQLATQRDAEATAKSAAIAQRDALAAERNQLAAARDEQAKLATERQSALTALQAQHDQLTQEKATLIAANAELTGARDQFSMQRDAEAKAKNEALAQRDAEAQAKSEAIAQRDALSNEKNQLAAARDEQAKLATQHQQALAVRQEDVASQLQRIQQLEAEIHEKTVRQQLQQEELIKAEAQIELIKDLLLREPGL